MAARKTSGVPSLSDGLLDDLAELSRAWITRPRVFGAIVETRLMDGP
jgi:hypothetical protein